MLKFGWLLHVHQVTIQLCFPEKGAIVLALDFFPWGPSGFIQNLHPWLHIP